MDILEAVKTVGSIVALITGVFIVIDRFYKDRPYVYLWPETPELTVGTPLLKIVVRNVSKEAIFIKSFRCSPPAMYVSHGPTIRHMIAAAMRQPINAVIGPESEQKFEWFTTPEWDKLAPTDKTVIAMRWAFTRSGWIPQFPVHVRNRVEFLNKLRASAQYKD
jgi:hypothetical protein